jgi:hypothetical protein
VNGSTSPILRVNEQLGFAADAVAAVAPTMAARPATANVDAARLALLDLSTDLPPVVSGLAAAAARRNVARLTDISPKGKSPIMLGA